MAKQMYNVTVGNETQQVFTLKEVKELLGDNKITTKGILAGEYDLVTIADMEEEQELETTVDTLPDTVEEFMGQKPTLQDIADNSDNVEIIHVTDNPQEEPVEEDTEQQALTNEDTEEDTQALTNEEDEPTQSDTEYPEVGDFEDEKAIKKYIKKLSNEQLAEWVEIEGAEYKPTEHESINRMRQAMAIKELHFPHLKKTPGIKKSKSKYAAYTTEQLVQMAMDADVEVRDDKGDMRILRMYTIMALKEAKILS